MCRCKHCSKGSQVHLTLRCGLWGEDNWGQSEKNQGGQVSSNSCPSLFTYNEKGGGMEVVTWSEGKVHFCRRCQKYCSSPLSLYESRPFLHQSGGQRRGWGLWMCWGQGSGFQSKLQGLCLSGSAFNLINTGLFPGTSVSHKKTFCSCCCWWPGLETAFRNPGRRPSIINWHLKCFQVISLSSCGARN